MALQIPVYDSPQIATKPLDPGSLRVADVSPAAYGAGLGQGLEQAAASVSQMVKEQRHFARIEAERADNYRAMDLQTKFSQEVNDILHNGTTGFFLSQQENALNTQPVYDAIQKAREKYASQAVNEYQMNAFNQRVNSDMVTYRKLIEEHVGKERIALYTSNASSRIKQVFDDINLNFNRPDVINDKLEKGIPDLVDYLKNIRGMSAIQINDEVNKYLKNGLEIALQRYSTTEGMARDGIRYLNRPDVTGILGADADKWRAKFQPSLDKEDGESAAQQMFTQSLKADPNVPNEQGARDALVDLQKKGTLTLSAYDEAVQRLDKKFTDFHTAQGRETAGYFMKAMDSYEKGGHNIAMIPGYVQAYLEEKGEWHRVELMDKAWWAEKSNIPPTPDQEKTLAHIYWLGSENPNAFDSVTEADFAKDYFGKLTPTQWDQAVRYAAGLRARPDKQTPGAPNAQQILSTMLGQKGIIPTKDDENVKAHDPRTWKEDQYLNFRYASEQMQNWLRIEMAKHPKVPVSEEEVRQWVGDKLVDTYDPNSRRWWFGRKIHPNDQYSDHYTKLEAEARGIPHVLTMDISKIDPIEKQQIIEAFQTKNRRDPTDPEILARYELAHRLKSPPGQPKPTSQGVLHD